MYILSVRKALPIWNWQQVSAILCRCLRYLAQCLAFSCHKILNRPFLIPLIEDPRIAVCFQERFSRGVGAADHLGGFSKGTPIMIYTHACTHTHADTHTGTRMADLVNYNRWETGAPPSGASAHEEGWRHSLYGFQLRNSHFYVTKPCTASFQPYGSRAKSVQHFWRQAGCVNGLYADT